MDEWMNWPSIDCQVLQKKKFITNYKYEVLMDQVHNYASFQNPEMNPFDFNLLS